jgi:glycerophosphoryl diester phosphodiesterase
LARPWLRAKAALLAGRGTVFGPPLPCYVAHRGASAFAAENTYRALQLGFQGARIVECDVQMTSDGQIVICHDETLRRTGRYNPVLAKMARTDFERILDTPISGLRFEDVAQVDVTSWREPGQPAQAAPLLSQLLRGLQGDDRGFFVEVKGGDHAIVGPLADLLTTGAGRNAQVMVIGFDLAVMANVKRACPGVPAMLLCQTYPEPQRFGVTTANELAEAIQHTLTAGLDFIGLQDNSALGPELVGAIHDAGLGCYVWNAAADDCEANAHTLASYGVDYIATNYSGHRTPLAPR